MFDYGHPQASSKSRNNVKSPQPHTLEDPRVYKKKYEQARDALAQQKKINDTLESKINELQEIIAKQNRELIKKQEINDVLMERVKCLKSQVVDLQSTKRSQDTSYEDKNMSKSNKSTASNEDSSVKSQPIVGGYFGSIFN